MRLTLSRNKLDGGVYLLVTEDLVGLRTYAAALERPAGLPGSKLLLVKQGFEIIGITGSVPKYEVDYILAHPDSEVASPEMLGDEIPEDADLDEVEAYIETVEWATKQLWDEIAEVGLARIRSRVQSCLAVVSTTGSSVAIKLSKQEGEG